MTRPLNYSIYILTSILFLLTGCRERKMTDTDLITVYKPIVSQGFVITGYENNPNTVITVTNPWQNAEGVVSRLLINKDSIPHESFAGQILTDNPQRIVCLSSTHVAMLDHLDATDRIVGVSGKNYISNPRLLERSESIAEIGYEGNFDYETILALKPDLVLMFSVNSASGLQSRLEQFGIPYLYIGDYVEEDPLGKAEWIVPLAEIIGERELGIKKYQEMTERYDSLKQKVADAGLSSPTVMLNTPFTDSWFMPSTESFVARMMKDAGANYIYRKNTGSASMPIDMEEAYKNIETSDFWINPGTISNLSELKTSLPKFKDTKPVRNGNVYNNNRILSSGGGNDCYESGVMNPDLILKDLIKIFHPELIEDDFTYYHKLK